MKRESIYIICLILALVSSFKSFDTKAQVLADISHNFNSVQQAQLHEKLYVHVSKNAFIAGEVIWFKIYNTDGSTNKPIDLSKVVYVELLDNANNGIFQAKVAMASGTGNGSFLVPSSLNTGNYRLRAYTSWMKNFDANYYFSQQIVIINPQKEWSAEAAKTVDYDVQFFPEGGHLVKGITSKVAFKITGSDGKQADGAGAIVDKQNDTVARFRTLKFGIGSFNFTPAALSGYRAVIKIGNKVSNAAIPQINESGYVMQVTNLAAGWDVNITSAGAGSSAVYLVVHTQNKIEVAEEADIANGSARFLIGKDKVAEGISYITLFDGKKQPLCERLIFKRPARKLNVLASADAVTYDTRKKVNISIFTQDYTNRNSEANLSLSVFKADSLQGVSESNIAGYLWLSASVKGSIQSPGYYLDNNTAESNEALDNLLLSQGCTQFDWSKILSPKIPQYEYLPEYTGPIISANLINTLTNVPAPGINAYLTIPGKYHQLYTAKSDSAGKLLFNTRSSYGYKEIIVKTDARQDSIYRIDIQSPFSEQYAAGPLTVLSLPGNIKNTIVSDNIITQVNKLFAKEQFEPLLIDTTLFYKKPSYSYNLDDYTRFKTMAEVVHEYVRFISVTTENGQPFFRMSLNKNLLPGQAVAIVDGEPVFESGEIYKLDPLKIKRLDVINNNYLYGPVIFNGIIGLITYNGDHGNIVLDPKAITINYEGLQQQRKFYTPVYDTAQQSASPIPDFRTTLYWNPDITTDGQGQNKVSFFTGDKAGKYVGIIEGISKNGEAGGKVFSFEVKK